MKFNPARERVLQAAHDERIQSEARARAEQCEARIFWAHRRCEERGTVTVDGKRLCARHASPP